MALELQWTDEAIALLDEIIKHLEENWTEREIKAFFQKLESSLKVILEAPHRHKKSLRKPNTREYLLASHTTIFYTYDEHKLYIMLIWPNRKDPANITTE